MHDMMKEKKEGNIVGFILRLRKALITPNATKLLWGEYNNLKFIRDVHHMVQKLNEFQHNLKNHRDERAISDEIKKVKLWDILTTEIHKQINIDYMKDPTFKELVKLATTAEATIT